MYFYLTRGKLLLYGLLTRLFVYFPRKGYIYAQQKGKDGCQKHTSILAIFSILEEENSGYRKGNAAAKKGTSHL